MQVLDLNLYTYEYFGLRHIRRIRVYNIIRITILNFFKPSIATNFIKSIKSQVYIHALEDMLLKLFYKTNKIYEIRL